MVRRLAESAARTMYRWLMPKGAKNALRLWLLLEERDKAPRVITEFGARSVVVLAPHMDDEVLGCGGAVRRHVLAGTPVTVVFMTDGSLGNRELREGEGLEHEEREAGRAELTEQRKRESLAAAKILGVEDLVFLDAPDGELHETPTVVAALRNELLRTRPSVLYVPSMLELHDDHWATSRVVYRCLDVVDPSAVVREYEVWTPLLANSLAIIDEVAEAKSNALRQFETQNADRLVHAGMGLNSYRSTYLYREPERAYAEAFHESTVERYSALFRTYTERR